MIRKRNIVTLEDEQYLLTIPPYYNIEQLAKQYLSAESLHGCLVCSTLVAPKKKPKPLVLTYGVLVNTGKYREELQRGTCWCVEGCQWYIPCLIPLVQGEPAISPPLEENGTIVSCGKLCSQGKQWDLPGEEQQELTLSEFHITDSDDKNGLIQWIWFNGYLHAINCKLWVPIETYKKL